MKLPKRVTIREVGVRDGLQGEKQFVPTDVKVRFIQAIAAAGVPRIEATSFMNSKKVPQMADAEEVMARLERRPGTRYEGVIANVKGAQRAAAAKVDGMCMVVGATDVMNRGNVGMTVKESMALVPAIRDIALSNNIPLMVGIACAAGCPYTGAVAEERVVSLADELVCMGVEEVYLADTVGFGNPVQMQRLAKAVKKRHPQVSLGVHIHDTRGIGLANTLACLEAGVTLLDGSVGGLGGCPFAPGSAGNVCTEDMVHMLHLMGVETGIDLDKLTDAARMAQGIVGRSLPGRVMRAGKAFTLHPIPESLRT